MNETLKISPDGLYYSFGGRIYNWSNNSVAVTIVSDTDWGENGDGGDCMNHDFNVYVFVSNRDSKIDIYVKGNSITDWSKDVNKSFTSSELNGHNRVGISPDGKYLLTAQSSGSEIKIYDISGTSKILLETITDASMNGYWVV